jgi:hypothetical protein
MTEAGPEQIIAPAGIPSAEAFGTQSVDIRHSIALQHLWNARHAARLAAEGEATKDRTNFRAVRGHSMSAVISAAGFIEAIVNEVFANVADWQPGRSGREGLADETVDTMRRLWNGPETVTGGPPVRSESIEKKFVLKKYQIALTAAGKAKMKTDRKPYKDANLLVILRNLLMHYKPPHWQGDKPDLIENELKNKVPGNQLAPGGLWYPDECLGAGCAQWACTTCVEIVDTWWQTMGIGRPSNTALTGWPDP